MELFYKMTKKEIVIKYIEKKIKENKWSTGEKLPSEPKLALEIGVSRMSVREGIEKLSNQGILQKKRGSGTYIQEIIPKVTFNNIFPSIDLTMKGYIEMLEVRMVLEPLGLKFSMENNFLELTKELKKNIEKMKENINKFIDYDMEFHCIISKYSNNNLLYNLMKIISVILKIHKKKEEYFYIESSIRVLEHEEIYNKILKNDIEGATISLKLHLEKALYKIKNI
ncbi:MAG: FadR/GntR family transcriptional regulator [Fusobacteriaceae bacterium]